ncbi:MAG: phosphoribosylpyrophosphate synthetase [Nitrospirae bacterium CG18_big_fil_WC_8_21_14_2_50_70_55]|nr:ribose-phosphate pyrophosphokinase [Deltaproteobacteria bacterium]OIP62522.1 MAG: phosphoribosylpyrophosphate synthetase [Nitrospirae bacterium CG2_30_70_394]PIQ07046.1 MAG: phosphoribosylpyrophosphate synthetase [Nitrospirae bacterium CG18_big_fil_WC_8_21_14_2_50_70_55]PIU78899.1 MAG: phosphoribosylpyrophosphate synthetase [Nitrospirae bacterium CG06_land_8_20_14_3_00_70_43]PIW82351.1 MAG: phosphoribosylpyrophosphate synthetase [Nitrospirae bacterium CG_4_8_14_3_um_filter_70_85]PIX84103.1 
MSDKLKIFSGSSNLPLALEVCEEVGVSLAAATVNRFSDGEIQVALGENVRGYDCFVVQSTCHPCNDNLMELLVMVDALKRASARRITAVVPYYGYARQDRKVMPRVPITARLVADLLSVAGIDRLLTMDLHTGQIQGFFDVPVDNVYAAPIVIDHLQGHTFHKLVVVSPDAGGVERARAVAKRMDAALAIIDKRRDGPNVAKVMHIIGDVGGRDCLIVDDMIDTAGTLTEAAGALIAQGAKRVVAACTHPVLSGPAFARIAASPLEEVVVANTIPLPDGVERAKITVLSVGRFLGRAVRNIHEETSVSTLFS